MLNNFIENSLSLRIIKKIGEAYDLENEIVKRNYKESKTYKFLKLFWEGTKINFRYSFLGSIAKIDQINIGPEAIYNSKVIKSFLEAYKVSKVRCINYPKSSLVVGSFREIRKEWYSSCVKISSIIMGSMILANLFFSILLHKEMEWLGIFIRLVILFLALGGLFCDIDWQNLKESSFLVKFLERKR